MKVTEAAAALIRTPVSPRHARIGRNSFAPAVGESNSVPYCGEDGGECASKPRFSKDDEVRGFAGLQ